MFRLLRSVTKPIKVCVVDYPSVLTAVLIALPAMAYGWTRCHHWSFPWLINASHGPDSASVVAVYLGLAAIAAISGGFSGVVIVFGLTPQSDLFRRFRQDAGKRMFANWTSIITCAFLSAALSVAAAALEAVGNHALAATLFAIGCLLYCHSAIRAVAILAMLLRLVDNDDKKAIRAALGNLGES